MPDGVGARWELLLAMVNALKANYAVKRTEENAHLASVYGAMNDGLGVDLLIPDHIDTVANPSGAEFEVKQNAKRLVDPSDCPACYISMRTGRTEPVGPSSSLGAAATVVTMFLYVTDRINDDAGATHVLEEDELVYMGDAFATAVTRTLREIGADSIYCAGAGVIQPFLTGQTPRSYDIADNLDVTALQIQQTWSIPQHVRY